MIFADANDLIAAVKRVFGCGTRLLTAAIIVIGALGAPFAQNSHSANRSPAPDQSPKTIAEQFSTAERLQHPGWWPTKSSESRTAFAGSESCRSCHDAISASQKTTQMAQTATPAARSSLLQARPRIDLQVAQYNYEITHNGSEELFTVKDGEKSISVPLLWSFGTGTNGQSYLLQYQGSFYEARLSYFAADQSFGITPDHPATSEGGLEAALGRRLSTDETPRCFGCHTTTSSTAGKLDERAAVPGITCEACHGPAATHVAASKGGLRDTAAGLVMNPGNLSPVDSVDFCGACHRTWWDITLAGFKGVQTLRFPAYRLEKSACWGTGDARITCIACHDPHQPLVKDTASYDSRCLSCHRVNNHATASDEHAATSDHAAATSDHPGPPCPTGTRDCASCHMQKYEFPSMHTKFTDHFIRVVQAGSAIPD